MEFASILTLALAVKLALSVEVSGSALKGEKNPTWKGLVGFNERTILSSNEDIGFGNGTRPEQIARFFGGGSHCNCNGVRRKRMASPVNDSAARNMHHDLDGRVVGGHKTSPGRYTSLVLIFMNGQQHCGGTILNEQCILTAAHCFVATKDARRFTVMAGMFDISRPENYAVTVPVSAVHAHRGFDSETYDNDVAVLRLARPLHFGPRIQPVCLAATRKKYHGTIMTVVGWGKTSENGAPSPVQLEVDLPILSNAKCESMLGHRYAITQDMMCAGYPQGGKDACTGDSGGPCFQHDVQLGIVSFGEGCARKSSPGIYALVAAYLGYILEHSEVNSGCSAHLSW